MKKKKYNVLFLEKIQDCLFIGARAFIRIIIWKCGNGDCNKEVNYVSFRIVFKWSM